MSQDTELGARAEIAARLDEISVLGRSSDGSVEAVTLGLGAWTVTVAPGTVARLGSSGLSEAATEAAREAVLRWLSAVADYTSHRLAERRS